MSNYKTSDLLTTAPIDQLQLVRFKTHLDLILLALESLAKIGSQSIAQAVESLALNRSSADFLQLWRFQHDDQTSKQLDLETIKSLVLIICYLAKQYRDVIRRSVESLEQFSPNVRESELLADYLDSFAYLYRQDLLEEIALNLLLELLFYSSSKGHLRLWQMLLAL